MYATIRRYSVDPARADELRQRVQTGFLPLIRGIDGLVGYYLIQHPDGTGASINLFRTRAGAEESTRRAADWVRENVAPLVSGGPPQIIEGEVTAQAGPGEAETIELAGVQLQDSARLVREMYDGFNRRELDRVADAHLADAEIVDMSTGQTLRGPDGYRSSIKRWLDAFPDGRIEIEQLLVQGDMATVEFVGRGTQTGPLATPTGEIRPTGRKVELRLCDVVRLKGGKVASVHTYYDAASMLQQLGVMQPAGVA